MPKLIVTEKGQESEKIYNFSHEGIVIGRADDSGVKLSGSSISRKHAQIQVAGNNCFLIDLGSGNGTFLNGAKVSPNKETLLRHGDLISIDNYNLSFSAIDEMLSSSFNEITDSDVLEVKLLKKVLRAIDKESIPSIEVLNGNFVGKKFFLTDDIEEVTIGRDESSEFEIREYVISRQHAKIVKKGERLFLEDMKSKNGTYLNNKRVMQEELHDGDRIALGTIVLIFRNPKEADLEAINVQARRSSPPPQNDIAEEQLGNNEIADLGDMELSPNAEDYPIPSPQKEKISLSLFEIGMIGVGIIILIFALISLVNLISK
jgi:pSer/pThr/pTyr-binding forkhead associated (FHA) protein